MKRAAQHLLVVFRVQILLCEAMVFSVTAMATPLPNKGIIPYSIRIWQTDDGLPQNSVFAIAQTTDGYLWVGTHDGLARFDGVRFTVLDDPGAPELRHASITALCGGSDGSLWIASEGGGVTRLKNGKVSHFTEADGLPSNQ